MSSRAAPLLSWLAVVASVLGCEPDAPPPEEPARLVVTERAVVDDAIDRVEILGDVRGEQEVRVYAQVPERIRVLHVEEGDEVHAGDPIVTLDADLQSSSLGQASAAVNAAESAYEQLGADIARVRHLVGEGALPRTQLETMEAQLRTSEAQLDQMRAARRTATEQRSRTVVRAPIDGTVALLAVQQGDMAPPQLPICTIVRTERLHVRLRVTEQDYVRVTEGMRVEIHPPALPDAERMGTVLRRSPVIDPLTRTAQVEVLVENQDGMLRPGMVALASIILSRRPDVVLAPSRALVLSSRTDTEREANVFVVDRGEGVARRLPVRLGRRYGDRVEIVEGLEGGEELVVQGQHLLRDGGPVRTNEAPPSVASAPRPEG